MTRRTQTERTTKILVATYTKKDTVKDLSTKIKGAGCYDVQCKNVLNKREGNYEFYVYTHHKTVTLSEFTDFIMTLLSDIICNCY